MTVPMCPDCVRRLKPAEMHQCRTYSVRCDHCGHPMSGFARQVLDAAEAHSRICPGLLRPLEATA